MKVQFCFFIMLLYSCHQAQNKDIGSLKNEIIETEKAFNQMAADSGVKEAFLHFSSDDAVMVRGQRLIKGKTEIKEYFESQPISNVILQWNPSFVDVASSGDLAYTYGTYTFSAVDSTGTEIKSDGYFHTVWKKQADGQWKFIYD